jgi:DNA end-binding protein Ku
MVVITEDDLADLPLPTKRTVDVLEFVPLSEVDPIYFNKSYYLEPDKGGLKPYALLRDALRNSSMVAVVKVAIPNREQLATLRVKDDVLVLATMMWPDEIRKPDFAFLNEEVAVRPQELAMADSLIQSMATSSDPTQFHDEFQAALSEVLAAKSNGVAVTGPDSHNATTGNAVDLLSSLQASIDRAIAKKGPVEASAQDSPAKATTKAAAAKKAPAKRASRRSA